MTALICPYCDSAAKLVDTAVIYNGMSYGRAWVCERYPTCDSYVGCHPKTAQPLGTLANAELRQARKWAHIYFDALWKGGPMSRHGAYRWLANRMRLTEDECHIGLMDADQCRRAADVSKDRAIKLGEHLSRDCR